MANDNIVTRLRNSCAHKCSVCDRENAYAVGDDAVEYIRAQQAEIERLRAENARLASFLHPVGEEARRG